MAKDFLHPSKVSVAYGDYIIPQNQRETEKCESSSVWIFSAFAGTHGLMQTTVPNKQAKQIALFIYHIS